MHVVITSMFKCLNKLCLSVRTTPTTFANLYSTLTKTLSPPKTRVMGPYLELLPAITFPSSIVTQWTLDIALSLYIQRFFTFFFLLSVRSVKDKWVCGKAMQLMVMRWFAMLMPSSLSLLVILFCTFYTFWNNSRLLTSVTPESGLSF